MPYLEENEYVERASVDNMALGSGSAVVHVDVPEPYSMALSASRPAFRFGMTQI